MHEISSSDTEDDDDDDEIVLITDSDDNRRRMLKETMNDDELEGMRKFKRDFIAETSPSKVVSKGKAKEQQGSPMPTSRVGASSSSNPSEKDKKGLTSFTVKSLVKDEMVQRRKESLGLGETRKLGGRPYGASPLRDPTLKGDSGSLHPVADPRGCGTTPDSSEGDNWSCFVCTL